LGIGIDSLSEDGPDEHARGCLINLELLFERFNLELAGLDEQGQFRTRTGQRIGRRLGGNTTPHCGRARMGRESRMETLGSPQ